MRSFFVGKLVELRLFGDDGYYKGRVIKAIGDLDAVYILFVPDGCAYGEYISTSSIGRIRVVGVLPEPEAPPLPRQRKKPTKKKIRRSAK